MRIRQNEEMLAKLFGDSEGAGSQFEAVGDASGGGGKRRRARARA